MFTVPTLSQEAPKMIHPIQFLDAYARKGALEHGCSISEYRDCMDEHAALVEWMEVSSRWMRIGQMSVRWWNAVANNNIALALVDRVLKDDVSIYNQHGMARALMAVRCRASVA